MSLTGMKDEETIRRIGLKDSIDPIIRNQRTIYLTHDKTSRWRNN